jgi:hypothetical protein
MKKLALLAAFLALPLALAAQTTSPTASITSPANGPANVAGLLYASNFAHWTIYPTQDGLRWTSPGQCYGTSGGVVFPLFSTTAPIRIVDVGVPANTETVTPTIASYNGAGCSVGLPATHAHTNYYLESGTYGLQEALNWIGSNYAVVVISPDWQTMGGTTGLITAAAAGANSTIMDCRTSSCIPYSGSTPAANSTGTGKTVLQTSPTLVTPVLGVATATSINGATITATAGVPSANCGVGALDVNTSASSASTVLYVCQPANTWTAVTVP